MPEFETRTAATGGLVFLTFTPLLGVSEVVQRFLSEESPDRHVTRMTIEDAEHIPAEERARIVAAYPGPERDARANGTPQLGSGRIFSVAEEMVTCDAFPIPKHWTQSAGIDFGWDHPTAAVRMARDRAADVLDVTHCYAQREATPVVHAAALRQWAAGFPSPGHMTGCSTRRSRASSSRRSGGRRFCCCRGTDVRGRHARWPGLWRCSIGSRRGAGKCSGV